MIITKTPYRISLFGGGSDYPVWYRENGGEVLSFSIDKYCYLTTRVLPPFFEHNFRVVYSKIESTNTFEEIAHPAVRESIRHFAKDLKLEIQHHGDLPARSGVGSSSAFAVGLIHSLLLLQNEHVDANDIASKAIWLEQEVLKEFVGSQDQIACALGGMNYIRFAKDLEWVVEPISIGTNLTNDIEDRMVMIYSGVHRSSSHVSKTLLDNIEAKARALTRSIELAREARNIILSNGDLDLIGEMLDESWYLKKEMNSQSVTPVLSELWNKAKEAGAIGGKILGAGGGGFCLFWVKQGAKEAFVSKLSAGLHVPVRISPSGTSCLLKT
jgi:D-glycero-alpha-D-manno-heptose-7-phosphate kinase